MVVGVVRLVCFVLLVSQCSFTVAQYRGQLGSLLSNGVNLAQSITILDPNTGSVEPIPFVITDPHALSVSWDNQHGDRYWFIQSKASSSSAQFSLTNINGRTGQTVNSNNLVASYIVNPQFEWQSKNVWGIVNQTQADLSTFSLGSLDPLTGKVVSFFDLPTTTMDILPIGGALEPTLNVSYHIALHNKILHLVTFNLSSLSLPKPMLVYTMKPLQLASPMSELLNLVLRSPIQGPSTLLSYDAKIQSIIEIFPATGISHVRVSGIKGIPAEQGLSVEGGSGTAFIVTENGATRNFSVSGYSLDTGVQRFTWPMPGEARWLVYFPQV